MDEASGGVARAGRFWHRPQGEGVLLADLSHCEPRTAMGAGLLDGCWYTLPYETAGGIHGVMVGMTEQSRPPDLRLPLPVSGWHAIYLGLYRGGIEPGQPFSDPFGLDVRLAGEPRAELVRPSVVDGARMNASIPGSGGAIEEMFWKAGDLADEELVIACPGVEAPSAAQLAFVRLVPMSAEEVAEYTGAGSDPATKLIIAQLDGHSGSSFFDGARTVDDLLSIYAPLADSDVGTLFLGTGGTGAGSTFYPSAVGTPYGEGEEAFVSERAARTVRSLRGFLEGGIDPVRVRVDFVQAMGIDVFLGFRMGTMAGPPPDYTHSVPFWREHPELRCRDSDGRTVARLSMAYPEVRRFYVDLLLELAAYGVEGVQLIYTRRAPFVLYEPPVIEAFRAEHGVDPRELRGGVDHRGGDPQWQLEYGHDERLMDLWAGYVTTFMRELREALDASGAGRRVRVAANVWPDHDTNRASGLDLRTWAREGLVDILAPAAGDSQHGSLELAYMRGVVEGTDCRFYPDLYPRNMAAGDYLRRAAEAYAGGAAGLSLWDCDRRIITRSQWNTIRRLGHRDDLQRLAAEPCDPLMHRLLLVDGWNPSHYT